MTALSVNLNKIALLRNSRGRNYPNVVHYAERFISLGAQGITIHPRPDERHITRRDSLELAEYFKQSNTLESKVELNIEGYPSEDFLQLIAKTCPHQCTLVPDAVNQLTSDHGWNFHQSQRFLEVIIDRIKDMGVRVAVFLDPDVEQVELAAQSKADRIELYTESYADSVQRSDKALVLEKYQQAARRAQELGLGVNAGHDLDLNNLKDFLTIPDILEVSIGHALIVECIEQGMETVMAQYLAICHARA